MTEQTSGSCALYTYDPQHKPAYIFTWSAHFSCSSLTTEKSTCGHRHRLPELARTQHQRGWWLGPCLSLLHVWAFPPLRHSFCESVLESSQSPEAFCSRYSPSYYCYFYLLFTSLKLGCFYCWLVHSLISKTVAKDDHVYPSSNTSYRPEQLRLQDGSCLCFSLFVVDGSWCCHCWSLILWR